MARTTRTTRHSARNEDLTDLEMLFNIHEAGLGEWASTTEVAIACGFTANGKGKTLATKVASRLAYMRDGGLLESARPDLTRPYTEPGSRDTQWRLSDKGEAIRSGRLSKAVERVLESMDPGSQLLLMRQLGRSGYVNGDVTTAFTLRREMQHHFAHRKIRVRP